MADLEAIEFSFPHDAAHDINGDLVLDELGEPDRVYDSNDFARMYNIAMTNGVYPVGGTPLQVIADVGNMYIRLMEGDAHIFGRFYRLYNAPKMMLIESSHVTLPRKDIIVIGYDAIERIVHAYVKTGTPNSNPQEPELVRTNDLWELKIAVITIRAGTQSVIQGDVQDTRGNADVCGWVTNNFPPIDTSNWFNQVDSWLNNMMAETREEWQYFKDSELELWRAFTLSIKGLLSEDIAGSLAVGITNIERNIFLTRNMDNLLDWDGGKFTTVRSGNTLTETITNVSTGVKMAERILTRSGNTMTTTITYYELNGLIATRKSFTTTRSGSTIITAPA